MIDQKNNFYDSDLRRFGAVEKNTDLTYSVKIWMIM